MKNKFLIIIVSFAFLSATPDQISHKNADWFVSEYMIDEARQYTVYSKEGLNEDITSLTVDGEIFELEYSCWIYYVKYEDNTGQYLIVNESNGNILEINADIDSMPDDLAEWRTVPMIVLTGNWINAQEDILTFTKILGARAIIYKPHTPGNPQISYSYKLFGDSIELRYPNNDKVKHYFNFSDEELEIHHFQNVEFDFYKREK